MFQLLELDKTQFSKTNFSRVLTDLSQNKIGALVVRGFWSEVDCSHAVSSCHEQGFDYYEGVTPPIAKIGITQFEHGTKSSGKEEYFTKAHIANTKRQQIFGQSDPITQLIQICNESDIQAEITKEGNEQYFAGLVRNMREALLHLDFGQLDGKGWSIEHVTAQFAWNIVLQSTAFGGVTTVFNKQWKPSLQQYKSTTNYDYDLALVQGVDSVSYQGQTGDLTIFNSRNFHKVSATSNKAMRLTVSSFFGFVKDNNVIFWS